MIFVLFLTFPNSYQGPPGCVPWGIVNTYLNDYLAVNRGMTVERATFIVLIFGIGNLLGMLAGGHGGAVLYQQDKRYPALFAGLMAMVGCVPFWILLNNVSSSTSAGVGGTVSLLAGICVGVTGPIIKATLQNVTLPRTRGQAFALFNTFDDFGRGLGPVFVATLITDLGGRTAAFNVGVLGWIVCGFVNFFIFFTVERDENTVQVLLAQGLPSARVSGSVLEEDIRASISKTNLGAASFPSHGRSGSDLPVLSPQHANRIIQQTTSS